MMVLAFQLDSSGGISAASLTTSVVGGTFVIASSTSAVVGLGT